MPRHSSVSGAPRAQRLFDTNDKTKVALPP